MSEKGSMQVIPLETTKLNLFHLTLPEIAGINKLMAYGYKLVDETDKDIQQYLKQKRILELWLTMIQIFYLIETSILQILLIITEIQ